MIIVVLAGAGLYFGWRLFWFMTDDALIAFRYASNSLLGYGYVWNPPPFRPVEGYTSFLWVVLLDVIWRWFGAEPPVIVNNMSLIFSFGSILITIWMARRMSLGEQLERHRLILLALVLIGILTNRTFLAWTSSGLETALFNFLLMLWLAIVVFSTRRDNRWLFSLTLTAGLLHLTRPDGLLILLSTGILVLHRLVGFQRTHRLTWRTYVSLTPLIIPIVHLGWRRSTYGEWLPNTYYAKYTTPWPEAGIRYLASFILEYALWFWIAGVVWLAFRWLRDQKRSALPREGWPGRLYQKFILDSSDPASRRFGLIVVVGTIAAHIGYYTLIIGGDHFEYRVFSYLVPLIFISSLWLINRLLSDTLTAACTLGLFILVSWPIQWTHWLATKDLSSRSDTWIMRVPVAPLFPSPVRWYADAFDKLQFWLIEHHVCMRHQEHKVFYEFLSGRMPPRMMDVPPLAGDHPIAAFQSVGVPGWVFPRVAILDAWGLNDYVVARNKNRPNRMRLMAHDRMPPEGYLESFSLNYGMTLNQTPGFFRREFEIKSDDIKATEQFWIDRIVHGNERPFTYEMLNRIGESLTRTSRSDSAMIYLRQALALDSTRVQAYVDLANCFIWKSAPDSAQHYLQGALDLEPGNGLVLTHLGRAFALTGYELSKTNPTQAANSFIEAERDLGRALAADSGQTEALVELASIHVFLGRVDSSIVYLSTLETRPPTTPAELQLLGNRYIFKGRRDLAVRAYRLAIENGLDLTMARTLIGKYPELTNQVVESGY